MVMVRGTHGGVNIEVKGIGEVLRYLRSKNKFIQNKSDLNVLKAANFYQQEVQESIMGNRVEPKSVDTGRFGRSINLDKIKSAEYKVFTNVPYAVFLEHGTSKMGARRHFSNSLERNRSKIREIVGKNLVE